LKEYAKYGNQWSKIEIPSRNSQAIGVRYRFFSFFLSYPFIFSFFHFEKNFIDDTNNNLMIIRSEAFQRKYHDKLLAIFNHFKEQRLGHPVEKPVSLPWKSRTELAHEKKLKKLEKSEKSEKSKSKPAKSTKSTKSAKSTKATKPTKSAKSTKTTKTTKAKTISSKPQRKVATKSK